MKKQILFVMVALIAVGDIGAMNVWSKWVDYMCGSKKTASLPSRIEGVEEVAKECTDSNGFVPGCTTPAKLWTRCNKLHTGQIASDSIEDTELLEFAQIMAKHEKKWQSWHVRTVKNDETGKALTKFIEDTFETPKGKDIKIFRDENSPYFQPCSTTEPRVLAVNLVENARYHEELKFLTTQLKKAELYWNIEIGQKQEQLENHLDGVWKQEHGRHVLYWNGFSLWQKIYNYGQRPSSYVPQAYTKEHEKASVELQSVHEQKSNTTAALRQEIEIFKANSTRHRNAFARSGLRKADFEALRQAREAYAKE
jgi:hypothetical protein